MAKNLLLAKLTETEWKLIADAMRNHDPGKLDYSDLSVIVLLNPERVIAALRNFLLGPWNNSSPCLSL
jgi:hypothetical protein